MRLFRSISIFMFWLGLASAAPPPAWADGDVAKGLALSRQHCARCHVVGEMNRMGGIDSTPSFFILAKREDADERLASFYERRPHPAFVRVPGVERWSKAPPYAVEFTVTERNIADIIAYVHTLKDVPLRRHPNLRRLDERDRAHSGR